MKLVTRPVAPVPEIVTLVAVVMSGLVIASAKLVVPLFSATELAVLTNCTVVLPVVKQVMLKLSRAKA